MVVGVSVNRTEIMETGNLSDDGGYVEWNLCVLSVFKCVSSVFWVEAESDWTWVCAWSDWSVSVFVCVEDDINLRREELWGNALCVCIIDPLISIQGYIVCVLFRAYACIIVQLVHVDVYIIMCLLLLLMFDSEMTHLFVLCHY
jgi:hypothetical protein